MHQRHQKFVVEVALLVLGRLSYRFVLQTNQKQKKGGLLIAKLREYPS